MPLYKTITVSAATRAHIWEITESEKELASGIFLTPPCHQRLVGMKSELHRRGFLSIRHLLALEGYQDNDLYYDDLGKPHLSDGTYISITHSYNFSGIIVSTELAVGIDIEKQREKILKIAHKFTPIEDYGSLSDPLNLIRKLTVVWGAKESLYKINSTLGLSFLNNINIKDFTMEEGKTTGVITLDGEISSFKINFLELEGFTCAYALESGNQQIR